MTNLSFGLDEKKLPRAERDFYRDLRRRAIYVDRLDDQLRVYPNQALAAHVLGYVGMDEHEVMAAAAGNGGQGRHRAEFQLQTGRRARLAVDGNGSPRARGGSFARAGRRAARRF